MKKVQTADLGRLPPNPQSFSYNNYYPIIDSPPTSNASASARSTPNFSAVVSQPGSTDKAAMDEEGKSRRSQMPVQIQHGVLSMGRAPSIQSQPISYMLTNVPRGLEYLAGLDRLFVRQQLELLEVVLGCDAENEYQILDGYGHEIYYAKEDGSCLDRKCFGMIRPFDMMIRDGHQDPVIRLVRPMACCSCCFSSCRHMVDVFGPPGYFLGRVEQVWTLLCWPTFFNVKDAKGDVMLCIQGPICNLPCCGDAEFTILSRDLTVVVGKISKKWPGLSREFFTETDNFGISFPVDLDARMKAILLGACMLIRCMMLENGGD